MGQNQKLIVMLASSNIDIMSMSSNLLLQGLRPPTHSLLRPKVLLVAGAFSTNTLSNLSLHVYQTFNLKSKNLKKGLLVMYITVSSKLVFM